MNDQFSIEVRRVLRETRMKAGLSQEALGKKAGVTHQTISNWECGRQGLTLGHFGAVMAAMGYRAIPILEPMEEKP